MKFWAAIGILIASAILGVIAYAALDRYVYENGINIDLTLIAVIAALLVISIGVLAMVRSRGKRAP